MLEDPDSEDGCKMLDSNSLYKDKAGDKVTWTTLFNEVVEYYAKVFCHVVPKLKR